MKNDLYEFNISDQKKEKAGLTKKQINSKLLSGGYPAIYIESSRDLSIYNGIIKYEGDEFSISGMTILELVIKLNNAGINAFITRSSISFMPAELLLDIDNNTYFSKEVDVSPKDMSEIHNENILLVPAAEEDSIEREVVKVYSIRGGKTHHYKYQVNGSLLYINNIRAETVVLVRYKIKKFFIYMNEENITEAHYLIKKDRKNCSNEILLENVNLLNWNSI